MFASHQWYPNIIRFCLPYKAHYGHCLSSFNQTKVKGLPRLRVIRILVGVMSRYIALIDRWGAKFSAT